eukprot:300880_1
MATVGSNISLSNHKNQSYRNICKCYETFSFMGNTDLIISFIKLSLYRTLQMDPLLRRRKSQMLICYDISSELTNLKFLLHLVLENFVNSLWQSNTLFLEYYHEYIWLLHIQLCSFHK